MLVHLSQLDYPSTVNLLEFSLQNTSNTDIALVKSLKQMYYLLFQGDWAHFPRWAHVSPNLINPLVYLNPLSRMKRWPYPYDCITSVLQARFQEISLWKGHRWDRCTKHYVRREFPRNGMHYKIRTAPATKI